MSNREHIQGEFERIVRIGGHNVDTNKNNLGDYLNPNTAKLYDFFRSGFGFGLTQQ